MSDSLGLSVGTTNLVAARVGRPPVTRRSVLTLFPDRAPEVGVPRENPRNQPGLVLTGFVERVGDPVPLVAADGSLAPRRARARRSARRDGPHGRRRRTRSRSRCRRTGDPPSSAHCAARCAPSRACRPAACPPRWSRTPVAALAGLRAAPGLPADGVVVLCDFGGSGTSITLADAERGPRTSSATPSGTQTSPAT